MSSASGVEKCVLFMMLTQEDNKSSPLAIDGKVAYVHEDFTVHFAGYCAVSGELNCSL